MLTEAGGDTTDGEPKRVERVRLPSGTTSFILSTLKPNTKYVPLSSQLHAIPVCWPSFEIREKRADLWMHKFTDWQQLLKRKR